MTNFIKEKKEVTRTIEVHSATFCFGRDEINEVLKEHVTKKIHQSFDERLIDEIYFTVSEYEDGSKSINVSVEMKESDDDRDSY